MRDLLMIKEDAMAKGEDGQMVDRRVAMSATVELLKVQGKYDNRPGHTGKDDSIIQLIITETEAKL